MKQAMTSSASFSLSLPEIKEDRDFWGNRLISLKIWKYHNKMGYLEPAPDIYPNKMG